MNQGNCNPFYFPAHLESNGKHQELGSFFRACKKGLQDLLLVLVNQRWLCELPQTYFVLSQGKLCSEHYSWVQRPGRGGVSAGLSGGEKSFSCPLGWVRDSSFCVLTQLSIAGVVTATVVKIPQAAVPGQRVHDTRRADGMDKGCFSVCCQGEYKESRRAKDFMARAVLEIVPTMQESAQDICSGEDCGVEKRPYVSDSLVWAWTQWRQKLPNMIQTDSCHFKGCGRDSTWLSLWQLNSGDIAQTAKCPPLLTNTPPTGRGLLQGSESSFPTVPSSLTFCWKVSEQWPYLPTRIIWESSAGFTEPLAFI